MTYLQFVDYGESHAPLRVVSLHGFPGVRSKQNREIAQNLAKELSCRVRVLLYPGLSTPGIFSFEKTIDALLEEFPNLCKDESAEKNEPIDLIGHSFGGFCSILLSAKFPQLVRRLVLLSPLLKIASSVPEITYFFSAILSMSVSTLPPEELAREFQDLSKTYDVAKLIAELNPKMPIKLMQANNDSVTPTIIAQEFRQYFRSHDFAFELVDQDHSFLSNRTQLSKEIAQFFR